MSFIQLGTVVNDIVKRLRDPWRHDQELLCKEAADEIERLRAEVARLHGALTLINDPARTELPKWVREYIAKTLRNPAALAHKGGGDEA